MNLDQLTIGEIKQLQSIFGHIAPAQKPCPTGRHVVVVDRGWIFAGDMSRATDGYVRLTNVVHVFRWESIGFSRVISEWKSDKVDLRKVDDVEIPEDAIVFRVPVAEGWGVK